MKLKRSIKFDTTASLRSSAPSSAEAISDRRLLRRPIGTPRNDNVGHFILFLLTSCLVFLFSSTAFTANLYWVVTPGTSAARINGEDKNSEELERDFHALPDFGEYILREAANG